MIFINDFLTYLVYSLYIVFGFETLCLPVECLDCCIKINIILYKISCNLIYLAILCSGPRTPVAAATPDLLTLTPERHTQHRPVATLETSNKPKRMVATHLGFCLICSGSIIKRFDYSAEATKQESDSNPCTTVTCSATAEL